MGTAGVVLFLSSRAAGAVRCSLKLPVGSHFCGFKGAIPTPILSVPLRLENLRSWEKMGQELPGAGENFGPCLSLSAAAISSLQGGSWAPAPRPFSTPLDGRWRGKLQEPHNGPSSPGLFPEASRWHHPPVPAFSNGRPEPGREAGARGQSPHLAPLASGIQGLSPRAGAGAGNKSL